MIRSDDIFIDIDIKRFEKICKIIRHYGFDHIIGVTLLGEGKKLWNDNQIEAFLFWRILFRTNINSLTNFRIKRKLGTKFIGENNQLLKLLDSEFSKYGAIPALHGLHHYKYNRMPQNKLFEELSVGKKLLERLLSLGIEIFVPPFNLWDKRTEFVCRQLCLSVDKCTTGFENLIRNMNDSQIKQLAKQQRSTSEVYCHPQRLESLQKFEIYLKTRRKYF